MKISILAGMGLAHYSRDLTSILGELTEVESVDIFSVEVGKTRFIESEGFAKKIISLYECWSQPYAGDDYLSIIARWDERLGPGVLNAALVADRLLFREYVTSAHRPRVALDRLPDAKETKQRILAALLLDLESYFEERRPDIYLTYAAASLFGILLYHFCLYYGARFLMLTPFRYEDYYCLADNPYLICDEARQRYLSENPFSNKEEEEAGKILDDLLQRYRGESAQSTYGAFSKAIYDRKSNFSLFYILRRTLSRSWTKTRDYISRRDGLQSFLPGDASLAYFRHLAGPRLVGKNLFETPPPDEPFVFYPLQISPEASSSVLAPFYTNQLELIERLSKSIPPHWKLYVKEHLPMLGKRTPEFYDRVREYYNVRLIDPLIPSSELIRRSRLVFTISGTAAMESAFLGKAYISLSRATYDVMDLGLHRPPVDELPQKILEAIRNAEELDPAERRRRQIRYLASGAATCFPFPEKAIWEYTKAGHDDYLPEVRTIAREIVRRAQP